MANSLIDTHIPDMLLDLIECLTEMDGLEDEGADDWDDEPELYKCDNCGYVVDEDHMSPFCPGCGKRMRAEDEVCECEGGCEEDGEAFCPFSSSNFEFSYSAPTCQPWFYFVPTVRKVYINGRYTTVEWEDGVKTTVGCSPDDPYSEYAGFAACVIKRLFGGSTTASRILRKTRVDTTHKGKKGKQDA